MKFYSYVVGGNKCLVFLEGIFEEIFGKLLINGKKAIFGTDAGKKIFVFEKNDGLKRLDIGLSLGVDFKGLMHCFTNIHR